MTEQDERAEIRTSLDALTRATGTAPLGWLGPEYGESTRTPELLAQAGIRYVCDWVNDEQPYPLNTSQGDLLALPITLPVDDVNALWDRRVPIQRYVEMLKESFDTLYHNGAANGRLLILNLHPWLIGQPFRVRYLRAALDYITRRQGVWVATGGEITEWYRQHPPAV
jgi:peptidoglycan/xylan/chitin deacetylase (PgdA/CDA1 family)